ncbi:outer membrane beta-barrel protein [Campylobacter gastrosuis]|uniref:Porin family protein n=1 Tax=Campylobacter gastrosuis TaxID=2974576 RepID=A0ABT7HR31_9BACT|nr:outer membrane beta-barrel protein [Campylobacter gastrosuis]MDL0089088.1 porin family protein [Campylobacter gastrosuis]
MKNLTIKALAVGVCAVSFAMADGSYFGVNGGYSNVKIDDFKESVPTFGIVGGADFDTHRIYGGYNYNTQAKENYFEDDLKGDAKVSSHEFIVGADLTPEISSSFRLFLGSYLGLLVGQFKANATDGTISVSTRETLTGFLVGARAGMLFDLNEANQIEFGAKVDKTWFKDGDIFKDIKQTKYGGYVGYNHKF